MRHQPSTGYLYCHQVCSYLLLQSGYNTVVFPPLLVCGIRYSAVRRQFGPTPDEELPVLEYQTQVQLYITQAVVSSVFTKPLFSNLFTHSYFPNSASILLHNIVTLTYLSLCVSVQQWRLLPYVAAVYVISHFSRRLHGEFVNFMIASMMGDKSDRQV